MIFIHLAIFLLISTLMMVLQPKKTFLKIITLQIIVTSLYLTKNPLFQSLLWFSFMIPNSIDDETNQLKFSFDKNFLDLLSSIFFLLGILFLEFHHLFLFLAIFIRQGIFPFHVFLKKKCKLENFSYLIPYLISQPGNFYLLQNELPVLTHPQYHFLVLFISLALVYISLLTLVENNIHSLFALFTSSHSSIVFLTLLSGTALGFHAARTELLLMKLALGGLGIALWIVEQKTHIKTIDHPLGLSTKLPLLGGFFFLFTLSLINMPLTLGYLSEELWVHTLSHDSILAVTLCLISMLLIGISAYQLYKNLFLGRESVDEFLTDLNLKEKISLFTLIAFLIFLGVNPELFL